MAHPTQDFRQFLQSELIRRVQQNPRYSVRAFARNLQIDKSTLSKFLNGKRVLGKNVILRLGNRLSLQPEQLNHYVKVAQSNKSQALSLKKLPAQQAYQQVALDSFHVISDWYHYGILELMRVEHFQPKYQWISNALGISIADVEAAVQRLERVGMLEITPTGKWVDLTEGTSTTIGLKFTDTALKKMQKQILSMAADALETVPYDERDQSTMTLAVDKSKIGQAKEKITLFRRDLARFLSRGDKRDEVYHFTIALYPVSQATKKTT